MIHNHYEGRGRGLSDLLKLGDVSEAVKVRSKRKLSKKIIEKHPLVTKNKNSNQNKCQLFYHDEYENLT